MEEGMIKAEEEVKGEAEAGEEERMSKELERKWSMI